MADAEPGDGLSDDEVARILRRAIELDPQALPRGQRVHPSALITAAADVGLDPEAVQMAIAEERFGTQAAPNRLDRFAGRAKAIAERRIRYPSSEVSARVEEWMLRAGFQPQRRAGDKATWRKRTDVAAQVQRAAASIAGGAVLSGTDEIDIQVVEVHHHLSLVRVEANRSVPRTAAVFAAGGSVGASALAGVGAFIHPAIAALSIPFLAAGGASGAIAKYGTKKACRDLERLLDQVAAAERPTLLGKPRRSSHRPR